ncbi:MAG: hypothetical protein KDJ77_13295 [Rhodobiaceae bacterium]|nr:hypothetical protein [Rhodobiaceae bacterium]
MISGSGENGGVAASAGARTLLRDCVHGHPGERLLIVEEPDDAGYYDTAAARMAAAEGRALGFRVYETTAPSGLSDEHALSDFVSGLTGFDHVVFFARVGDQLRFSEIPGMPPATMCYTLDGGMLDSAFGTACHPGMCEIKAAVDAAFAAAEHIRVTCPHGTDYAGRPVFQTGGGSGEVTLKRFPMLVPRPVPAAGMAGRVALSRFLVGTGSHFYEPYWVPLEEDVFAIVEGNRIVRFDGPGDMPARVSAHYEQVAGRFGIDPWYVHSWHPGIHPGCGFSGDAMKDMLRWSGSAFGNPRLLHFHTCGNYAPGEISWNLVDATVVVDGVALWEAGRFYPERLPGSEALLARHPRLAALFEAPRRDIGL